MGFWSKFVGVIGVIAAPFTGGASLYLTAAAVVAPKLVDKIVDSVIDFVVQPFMGLLGVNAAPNVAEAERQQGVLVSRLAGGSEAIPVVYGHRKVGGLITFAETGSSNNKYLWVAYVFTEGPIEGLFELYIDDVQLPSDIIGKLNAGQLVTIAEGRYKNRVAMRFVPGTFYTDPSTSTLGTELKTDLFADSPSFKNTMVYNGLATLFVRYEWFEIKTQEDADANPFNGQIPDVAAVILGRRVASLVTSTSESYEYGAAGYSERYSTNPAEILLDYLRNPRYGKGLKNADIDWATFRTAAAKCNQVVTYTASGVQGPIMTLNYVLDTNSTIFDNVKQLLQNFRAYMPYVQGKYKLKIEDAGNESDITSGSAIIAANCVSTYALAQTSAVQTYDIQGEVQYTGIDRSSKYNQVVVTYVDARPEAKWSNQQIVYPATESERLTYVALDGNRENKLEVTFSGITNYAIAYDFARLLFMKSRYQETCSLTVSSHAFELEPGDNIIINAAIMKFGIVPWRVINITHNNDYTFSLSCVRNPDFMYPYVRAGEVDRILSPFIPRGVEIFYPRESNPNYSLQPPTRAPYNPDVYVPPTNLAPTDPTLPGGGGVGGPTGPINTNPPNNVPTVPPRIQPLVDIVDFTNITYALKNGLVFARITFRQPATTMYGGLIIYYKNLGATSYISQEVPSIPGSNKEITFDLGPLAISTVSTDNTYEVLSRVKYVDGRTSTKFTRVTLNPKPGVEISGPVEVIDNTGPGWPTTPVVEAPRRDTKFLGVRGSVPSIGSGGTARSISFIITQDTVSQPANTDVSGMVVYWKLVTDFRWNERSYNFGTYTPGTATTVAHTGSIGVVGGADQYNFAFKFLYKDGTLSSYVYVTTWRVQNPLAVYPYDPSVGQVGTNVLSSSYSLPTVDQVGSGSELNSKFGISGTASDIGVFARVMPNSTVTGIRVGLQPPALDSWRGTRIRYRPVSPIPQDWTRITDLNRTLSTFGQRIIDVSGIPFDTVYEFAFTPIVFSSNIEQDSNFTLYGSGYVHNRTTALDYPTNGNWTTALNMRQVDTNTLLGQTGQPSDAGAPTVNILGLEVYERPVTNTAYKGYYRVSTTSVQRNQYMRIAYNGDNVAGLTKLYIYRRTRNTIYGVTGNGPYSLARHYGVGRWERVEITHTGTGTKVVNLRMPTDFKEFDGKYGLDATRPLLAYSSTNVPILTSSTIHMEVLIVAVVGTTVSTKAQWVQPMSSDDGSAVRDYLIINKPTVITYASEPAIADSSYTVGYLRRLGDARTTLVATNEFEKTYAQLASGSTTSTVVQSLVTPKDGPAIV